MKTRTKLWLLIFGLVAALAILILIPSSKKKADEKITEKEGVYRIGNVSADTKKGEIQFKGKVFKDKGWVQHLVYLQGYKWLKDESAIISEARLTDLQRAIAILDWKLWDELYFERKAKMPIFVKWRGKEIPGHELVLVKDNLELGDFLFLGSPYFNHIALGVPSGVDCRLCPLFALEEKALRELFVRESGQSGYELNSQRMPFQGAEVTIIIRLPK